MDTVQIQCIQHGDDIFSEQFNRIRARSGRGLTVTSRVATQAPELLTKLVDLRFPHGIIRAEGIREHQDWRSALAFQRVMDARISGFKDRHLDYSSVAGILPRLAAQPHNGNACFLSMLNAFENQSNSLADTDAHGAQRMSAIGPQKLIERSGH